MEQCLEGAGAGESVAAMVVRGWQCSAGGGGVELEVEDVCHLDGDGVAKARVMCVASLPQNQRQSNCEPETDNLTALPGASPPLITSDAVEIPGRYRSFLLKIRFCPGPFGLRRIRAAFRRFRRLANSILCYSSIGYLSKEDLEV
ncbi:hypothetical protein ABZP36_028397 [Zizania latifolia]